MQVLDALAFLVGREDGAAVCQPCALLCAGALYNCRVCAKVPVSHGPLDTAPPALST